MYSKTKINHSHTDPPQSTSKHTGKMRKHISHTGCGKKSNPLKIFAVFSAVAWNFKAKFY